MLEKISFCSCARLDIDEPRENQCMFFSFTERAQKVLSDEFLWHITEGTFEENLEKTGIPLEDIENLSFTPPSNNLSEKIFIKKIQDNYYRIPTIYIDPFIRCLFKYLPAFYLTGNESGVCCEKH
jgi:hypothetical protein